MVDKVMIEIDDPEECGRCPFVQEIRADFSAVLQNNMTYVPHYICQKIHKEIGNIKVKRTDCPLRPMPERVYDIYGYKLYKDCEDKGVAYAYGIGYAEGWNACIDYLEGKENE